MQLTQHIDDDIKVIRSASPSAGGGADSVDTTLDSIDVSELEGVESDSNAIPQRTTIEGHCCLLVSRYGVGCNTQGHSVPTALHNIVSDVNH